MYNDIKRRLIGPDPKSYDIGSDNGVKVISRVISPLEWKNQYPLIATNLTEEARDGQQYFSHIRYPYLALEYLLSGSMEFTTGHDRQIAQSNSLYIISPGSTVKFLSSGNEVIKKLALIVAGVNLNAIIQVLHLNKNQLVNIPKEMELEKKLRNIGSSLTSSPENNSLLTYSLLLELSSIVKNNKKDLSPLEKAIFFIENNFKEDISIPNIASQANVSISTLRRLFLEKYNLSPLEYLTNLRLNFAVEKLNNKKLSVKQIAFLSGFSSSARFCTVLKEKYNKKPSDFRS